PRRGDPQGRPVRRHRGHARHRLHAVQPSRPPRHRDDGRGHAAREGARDRRREGEGAGGLPRGHPRGHPAARQRPRPARRAGRGARAHQVRVRRPHGRRHPPRAAARARTPRRRGRAQAGAEEEARGRSRHHVGQHDRRVRPLAAARRARQEADAAQTAAKQIAGPTRMTAHGSPPRTARRTHGFTESVIREMTRVANEAGAVNLAQGFPDFPAPEVIKEAACEAIRADINQYAITWGSPRLRRAIAAKYARFYGMEVDEAHEITVTCGATEAAAAALLAIVDPGDEVVIFEPFYENYGPDTILCDAKPVWVPLPPDGGVDLDRLAAAFSPRTRAIVLNTPNNPTGHVFTRGELEFIAELCQRYDAIAITDEI